MMKSIKKSLFPLILLLCLLGGQSFGQQNNSIKLNPVSAKIFTIDENTGEVKGCDLIKLNRNPTNKTEYELFVENEISQKQKEIMFRKVVKKGDELFIISTINKKYHVCIDASHGGFPEVLYFFNEKFKLINKYTFKNAGILDIAFNSSESYLRVWSQFSGDYYFFALDGRLIVKNNFNKITGDRGTSYGTVDISPKGDFYLLPNNKSYFISQKGKILAKLNGGVTSSYLSQNSRNIYLIINQKIMIYDLKDNNIKYLSESPFESLQIKKSKLKLKINKSMYEYNLD